MAHCPDLPRLAAAAGLMVLRSRRKYARCLHSAGCLDRWGLCWFGGQWRRPSGGQPISEGATLSPNHNRASVTWQTTGNAQILSILAHIYKLRPNQNRPQISTVRTLDKPYPRKEIILRSNSPWGFYPFQPPDSPKGQVARVSGELPPCMTRGSPLRPLGCLT